MDIKIIFCFCVLNLLYIVFLQAQPLYKPTTFPYSRCKQIVNNVTCEALNISKDRREKASVWPSGPFAIPMSKYGCPESQSRGWTKGFNKWITVKDNVSSSVNLQYCIKIRNDAALDSGRWIPGKYNIYMKGHGCPLGFEEFNDTISFKKQGHAPNIAVSEEDNHDRYINVTMCERTDISNLEDEKINSTFGMLKTIFMLEKIEGNSCPQFKGAVISEETTSCLYEPEVVDNFDESETAELTSEYILTTDFIYWSVARPERADRQPYGSIGRNEKEQLNQMDNKLHKMWTNFDTWMMKNADFNERSDVKLVWYNFDLRRSLDISMISNLPKHFYRYAFYCFYDEKKWSFLHHEAPMCKLQNVSFGSRLGMRNVRGRFITLMFEETRKFQERKSKQPFKVYISNPEEQGGEVCNEDIGMADGSIKNFQLTASSSLSDFLPSAARPFSSGWCYNLSDPTPWILVDLLTITTIEGVSIWNRQTLDWSSFNLFYGTRIDDLQMYTEMVFQKDVSKPMYEEQMFMIPLAIKTRFIKFDIQIYQFGSASCLTFELHGCKFSGIPAFNCNGSFDMFTLEAEMRSEDQSIVGDTIEAEMRSQNQSIVGRNDIDECNSLCRENDNCSVASFSDKGLCVQYMRSRIGIWKMNDDTTGHWFVKLCCEGTVDLFPSFKDLNEAVIRNVQYIEATSVITSIGYPFSTRIGNEYTWIVNFHEKRYVKFVFTNVSMDFELSEEDSCNDRLLIGSDLHNDTKGTSIDGRFNDIVFVVETGESLVFVTFIPCITIHTSSKFRAIITGEGTPACLSIDQDLHTRLSKGREEICTEPKMILTSLSILNLPFVNVEERFEIRAGQHHSIQIQFIDFYIVCPRAQAEIRSKFTVIDHRHYGRTYCNTDRPPKTVISKGSRVSIIFGKYEDSKERFMRTEGFRLQYFIVNHSFDELTDYIGEVPTDEIVLREEAIVVGRSNSTKVCSRAFKKCYNIFSSMSSWNDANSVCLELRQHLLVLHSRDELQYIHYLLREMTYQDNQTENEYQDESFRAHIVQDILKMLSINLQVRSKRLKLKMEKVPFSKSSLNGDYNAKYCLEFQDRSRKSSYNISIGFKRFADKHRRKKYTWVNNFEVTFTAWSYGYPSFGDCARTYFQPFNTNNTWESEDCATGLAQYFICQTEIDEGGNKTTHKTIEKTEDICENAVQNDRHVVFSTYSGKACQRWDYLTEDARRDFYKRLPGLTFPQDASNQCADPSLQGFLWCYVKYPEKDLWEPCFWPSDINVAVNKPANSSSVWEYGHATAAVDGNINQNYFERSCFHTHFASTNWWYVDLQQIYRIKEVRVYNRMDGSSERANNITVWVGNHLDSLTEVAYSPDPLGAIMSFVMPMNTEGRYVKLVQAANSYFHLCEVQVFVPEETVVNISEKESTDIFNCSSGLAIPGVNKCDKSFECHDFTDELSCMDTVKDHRLTNFGRSESTQSLPARLENGAYYLCERSKEWLSILAKCDDVIDCLDASDEVNCSQNDNECDDSEFSCGDGNCIKLGQVCDFISDCAGNEDEFCELEPCRLDEYMCQNQQCIPRSNTCNAIPDCADKSDEIACEICRSSFHCDADKCIPHRLKCDNFPDCDDGSDEHLCHTESRQSCQDWWESGYQTSGKYVINGLSVYCDFSSIITVPGWITFQIRDIDVTVHAQSLYTRSTTSLYASVRGSTSVQELIFGDQHTCFLEVKSTCRFPYQEMALIDNIYQNSALPLCSCVTETFNANMESKTERVYYSPRFNRWMTTNIYNFEQFSVRKCDESKGFVDARKYYTIYDNSRFSVTDQVVQKVVPVDVTAGPITCSYKYSTDVSAGRRIYCEREKTTIPLSMSCLYDVDAFNYMTGCRSGEHLQNCGNVSCPENTIKCPGSYCIPLRFVCDGDVQCPGGEDEQDCSCTDASREVIVLIEDTSHETESKTAAKRLAKQFYTSQSVVRLLYYKSEPRLKTFSFTNRLLEIQEERVSDLKETKCRYKSMARDLLRKLQFSEIQTKGIVFIEDSAESSIVSNIILSNLLKPSFTVYRIIKDYSSSLTTPDRYEFVKDVHISRWSSLFTIGYRRFPEICTDASQVPCTGRYRCSSSKQCIPLEQVCDGVVHCGNGDDEQLCDFVCRHKCECIGQKINCRATNLNMTDINVLSIHTRSADLSENPGIKYIISQDNLSFPFMLRLNLSSSEIQIVNSRAFFHINNLISLDIGNNRIQKLPENIFGNLYHLTYLNLDGNYELRVISSSAFRGLRSIRSLRISGTKLKIISSFTFSDLRLQSIDISNNEIEEIEDYAFNNSSVQRINFENNKVLKFGELIFHGVTSLQELHTPAFKFCCVRPCYVDEDKCYPSKDEFSSCEDLMRNSVLQAVLWLVGISSLLGNLGSIIYRLVYDRKRLKIGYGIFVTNLAAADFIMGVYLIMIAVADSLYRNRYIFMDDQWRNSIWCVTAGILSTVSSEASVLFLCLITLDRLLVIKYPFGTIRFDPLKAYLCCGFCWAFAIALAIIPAFYTSYFQNRFYSKTGVCIALPLTRDKPPGWIYSVAIFVGLNFCTFIIVAFGQLSIFTELRKSTHGVKKTQKSRKRDLQVARNLILVATTDFLCWFPIGVMGIMALNGHPISGDVYAWTAVFILPINSALNPILYTLTAIIAKQSFNPNIEEQSRTEVQKEIGSTILQYQNLSPSVRMKREVVSVGKTRSINELLNDDGSMSVAKVTLLSRQLIDYMRVLHGAFIGIERISEENIYIRVDKKKERRPIIVLDSKTSLMADERMAQENIHQFGILLRKMIAKCEKKENQVN